MSNETDQIIVTVDPLPVLGHLESDDIFAVLTTV